MARSSGRRLAHRYESERRAASFEDDLRALVARQASASTSTSASASATSTLPPIGPVVKIPLPPAVPTSTSTETPAPVSIPTSISSIIPATCAVVGTLLVAFLVWHFYYRRQRRKNKTNNRSTWYIPSKFQEGLASIEPTSVSKSTSAPPRRTAASLGNAGRTVAPSAKPEASSDKTETPAAYPPRKVSSTPRAPPRSVPGPSPLRNQSKLTAIPEAKATSQGAAPVSPVSPGPTPTEKTAFVTSPTALISPPPVAAHLRFSFLRDVNQLPDFRAQEAVERPQPMKRSASLLSARMSVRRKPQRKDTAPAETSQPEVPSLRITDADSPLEDSSAPQHPMAGKLVSVTDPYESTMPDELSVTVGETLRVVECYDDDWCLCERVGRKKGRGILPQLCIMEKGGVQRNMRFSMLVRE